MGQRFTILFVEDDPHILAVLPEFLPEDQFRTLVADCGHEAVRILAQEHVDLMVTDLMMPGTGGGLELAAQAKLLCPDLLVMFMTGYYSHATEAEKIGRVLYKPFPPREMEDAIRECLFGWRSGPRQHAPSKPT